MDKKQKKQINEQLTHWKTGVGKPSPYLGSWDLPGNFQNVQLTIKEAIKETTKGLKDDKTAVILHFVEQVKPMILNATNSKMLRALSGSPFIENWKGIRIELRVEKDVKAFGSVHDTLRIVNKSIVVNKPVLDSNHSKYIEIRDKIMSGAADINIVANYYIISDELKKAIKNK